MGYGKTYTGAGSHITCPPPKPAKHRPHKAERLDYPGQMVTILPGDPLDRLMRDYGKTPRTTVVQPMPMLLRGYR
jgi:hypothetical protein